MKKFMLLLALAFIVISCGDDLATNTPAIQGRVDDQFFRSSVVEAQVNEDETVSIIGETGEDILTLNINQLNQGEYVFGENDVNTASYLAGGTTLYYTGTQGSGMVNITKLGNRMMSGEFFFYALLNNNQDTINVNKGAFFDVPIVSSNPNDPLLTCDEAIEQSDALQGLFESLDPSETSYDDVCEQLKNALLARIDQCGDASGDAQDILDTLPCYGDNSPEPTGSITVVAGNSNKTFDEIFVTLEDGMVKVLGETSASDDHSIYFEITQDETGTDILQGFTLTLDSAFEPQMQGSVSQLTDEITINSNGQLEGTFSGTVENDTGATIELTDGNISIEY